MIEFLQYIAWAMMFVGFGLVCFIMGDTAANKPRKPKSALDKKGGYVLDYNHNTHIANISTGSAHLWDIHRSGGEYGQVVIHSPNGNEVRLQIEEAHQLGRALEYVSWREDL